MPTRASGVPGVLVPRMVRRCRLPARLWVRDYRLAVRRSVTKLGPFSCLCAPSHSASYACRLDSYLHSLAWSTRPYLTRTRTGITASIVPGGLFLLNLIHPPLGGTMVGSHTIRVSNGFRQAPLQTTATSG